MTDEVKQESPPEPDMEIVTDELKGPDAVSDDSDEQSTDQGATDEEAGNTETSASSEDDGNNAPEQDRPKRSPRNRIKKLTRKLNEKDSRIGELEARLRELESNSDKSQPAEPQPDDFESYDDYVKAAARYAATEATTQNQKAEDPKPVETKPDDLNEEVASQLEDIFNDGLAKHKDFQEKVTNPSLQITQEMLTEIVDSDYADDILYELASNPDEALRISELNERGLAREIGKIEARLIGGTGEIETKPETPTPKQKQSKAPKPIEPVGSNNSVERNMEDMDYDEYRAKRIQQMKRQAGYA